jgi:hypothetical protein
MKLNFISILILLILAVWIIQAIKIVFSQKGFTWKSGLNFLASACLIIGAVGFFGSALSATTTLGPSQSFEWPIGNTDAALKCQDGTIVVPHEPSGRVQIYDQSLQFIRGWSVSASGGSFKLFPANDSTFFIYTARGNMKYHYDLNGNLLSSQKYSGSYPKDSPETVSVSIPTPFYLQVFTHPFASWFVAVFGMLLLFITGEARKKNLTRKFTRPKLPGA